MKPGVFTQLYIHLVIAPKYRERLLVKEIRSQVFRYISGILTSRGHKSIIINGVLDHVHIFYGENLNDKISDQEQHHKKRTFKEEYMELLNKFAIKYDERYLFEFFSGINESQIIINPLRGL